MTTGSLEQFTLLAKSTRGMAATNLVMQAVASPGVFVFGELLDCPNIQELSKADDTRPYWDLLNLFAYGTYEDFVKNRDSLPGLSDPMILKLRQLTVVTVASKSRRIPYARLLELLHIRNVRELEDLIIDSVYKGIIVGKLDQQNQCVEVEQFRGRDVRLQQISQMTRTLSEWASCCQALLANLQEQIENADQKRQKALDEQKKIEEEFNNLKKTLKVASGGAGTPDIDENIPGEVSSTRGGHEPERKKEKTRHKGGLRGSSGAKIFSKN